jgi:hypothetical protein
LSCMALQARSTATETAALQAARSTAAALRLMLQFLHSTRLPGTAPVTGTMMEATRTTLRATVLASRVGTAQSSTARRWQPLVRAQGTARQSTVGPQMQSTAHTQSMRRRQHLSVAQRWRSTSMRATRDANPQSDCNTGHARWSWVVRLGLGWVHAGLGLL